WVADAEVEKLLRHGEGWLAAHPERDLITRRYLKNQGRLARAALDRLVEEDGPSTEDETAAETPAAKERVRLHDERLAAVRAVLRESGARRLLDLGCGEGKLIRALIPAA